MIEPVLSPEVADALAAGRAVVALESTIFSHLGLPSPANHEALRHCLQAVRDRGAVPAVTAQDLGAQRTAVTATLIVGNNTVSWSPTITVHVPAGAVAGTYSGTITHSVS